MKIVDKIIVANILIVTDALFFSTAVSFFHIIFGNNKLQSNPSSDVAKTVKLGMIRSKRNSNILKLNAIENKAALNKINGMQLYRLTEIFALKISIVETGEDL